MASEYLHVMVGILRNAAGEVLLSERPPDAHQGGLWEFPGGKLDASEKPLQGLTRELHEELGIGVESARPLIRVRHRYSDRPVLLDVWEVMAYAGEARGLEGQALRWVAPAALPNMPMPAADVPIVTAVRLPDRYLITPEPKDEGFLAGVERALKNGIRLIQLRSKQLTPDRLEPLAQEVASLTRQYDAWLLINADMALARRVGAQGVHLTGAQLQAALTSARFPRPHKMGAVEMGSDPFLVSASCHNARELAAAEKVADFAVLSPVQYTPSHPDTKPLGWDMFQRLVDAVNIPVYALGGVGEDDLETAWSYGAQGIASVRGLWPA